jgi:hypothetical protein
MPHLRQAIASLSPANSVTAFVRAAGGKSVRQAVWRHKLAKVRDLFDGGTSEEQEDEALAWILSAESGDEAAFFVNNLSWDAMDDDLDEPDLDQVLGHTSRLLERRDYPVILLLRRVFAVDPWTLPGMPFNQLTAIAQGLPAFVRQPLANELVALRDPLLNGAMLTALRGRPTLVRELRVVVDVLSAAGHSPNQLTPLSWELQYTDMIGTQLARGEVRVLIQRLPDLVNAQVPGGAVQRNALFDMLRRWDREFVALDELVKVLGSASQKTDMRRFLDMRRLFMDNFPAINAPPNVIQAAIQAIVAAITGVGATFQDLVEAIQRIADAMGDLSVPSLFGTDSDALAVNTVNILTGQNVLQLLPTVYKSELVNRLLDGAVEDEEEQAILNVLRTSKGRSTADFAQIAAQATWEKLYNSFDGQEYDDLEGMFTF